MLILYKNIKERRMELGMSQQELAEKSGYTDRSSIAKIETGKVDLTQSKIKAIADALNTTSAALMGESSFSTEGIENIITVPKFNRIPLLGTIACGEPILAQENVEGDVDIPEQIRADFALRCKGDSMIDARICDGDIVYIKQQPTVENGQIGAVLIGDEATLKKVYISEGTVTLMACNTNYAPLVYSGEKLNEIRILGKAVGFTSCVV